MELVRRVLAEQGIEAQVLPVEVRDLDAAARLRFLGSPSIRVDGADIKPGRLEDPPFFGCRTYRVQGKMVGVPPEEWLLEAVRSGQR
jgi:hypothetical protein